MTSPAVTGVLVVGNDDSKKIYGLGKSFEMDGYGDLIIKDAEGNVIGMRKRGSFKEVEALTGV